MEDNSSDYSKPLKPVRHLINRLKIGRANERSTHDIHNSSSHEANNGQNVIDLIFISLLARRIPLHYRICIFCQHWNIGLFPKRTGQQWSGQSIYAARIFVGGLHKSNVQLWITSISCVWSSITTCCCLMVPSSSLFRSSSVLPSSAANCKSMFMQMKRKRVEKWISWKSNEGGQKKRRFFSCAAWRLTPNGAHIQIQKFFIIVARFISQMCSVAVQMCSTITIISI